MMNRFLQDIRLGGQQVITPVEGGELGIGFGVNEVIKLNVVGAVEIGLYDDDKVNSITTKVGVSAGAGVAVIPIGEVSYSATMGSKPVHTKPIRQKKKKTK